MNNLTNIEPVNKELNLVKYETKKINQTVKRNIERFPESFCFQLTQDEFLCLRSQIATLLENEDMRSQFATA